MKPVHEMEQRELEILFGAVNAELGEMGASRKRKAAQLNAIQAELTRRKEDAKFKPSISDHAMLRYLERVMGVDVAGLRVKLLSPSVLSALRSGASSLTFDGVTYRMRDNKVITIIGGDAA